jgi:hypothetical protein
MHVPSKTVADWIKGNKFIGIGNAYKSIKRFYCYPMTQAETCPKECEQCRELLTRLVNLEDAKNPAALFIYKLKDAASKIIDNKPQKKIETVSDVGNPFLELLKEFDEKKT